MILADTTIWSSRLRKSQSRDGRFANLIARREIACHPWIFGELLLGGIAPAIAADLLTLDFLPVAPQDDVLRFIRQYHPPAIGWVDVNLVVSCLNANVALWTEDKALRAIAETHGVSALL